MSTTPTPATPRRSPLTVQGWHTLVLGLMGILVLAAAIAGGMLLARTDDVAHQLIDEVQPARSAAYRLQASLANQETALRGYALSADRQFLTPYYDGLAAETTAVQEIRTSVGNRVQMLADVDAIEREADAWRAQYVEPFLASVTPGAPRILSPAVTVGGNRAFGRIRQLFDVQNQHLNEGRVAAIADLDHTRWWRNAVLGIIIATLLATAMLLAFVMRAAVTRPLTALAAACRRITEGNFDERIVPQGPKDIRSIATDVENMRQRIVTELEATRSTGVRLDEQAVELRRSNAELEQFAYVASHDLQEPLRKVTSFCQLIEKRYGDKLDERGVEYIAFAVDGAKRMQVLINDLLTFSRVGRLNSAHTDVDLDSSVAAAMANLSLAIEESGAEIVLPTEPLPRIFGDPTLMTMLLQNLIGNAIKFAREGLAPRIVIECGRGPGADEWLFTVSDNGIGIAPEFADKVFVIFQRLHGRDSYGGTGIGLALCKKIVEYHDGAVWIDTAYTDGTRFMFTLPMAPTTAPTLVAAETSKGSSA